MSQNRTRLRIFPPAAPFKTAFLFLPYRSAFVLRSMPCIQSAANNAPAKAPGKRQACSRLTVGKVFVRSHCPALEQDQSATAFSPCAGTRHRPHPPGQNRYCPPHGSTIHRNRSLLPPLGFPAKNTPCCSPQTEPSLSSAKYASPCSVSFAARIRKVPCSVRMPPSAGARNARSLQAPDEIPVKPARRLYLCRHSLRNSLNGHPKFLYKTHCPPKAEFGSSTAREKSRQVQSERIQQRLPHVLALFSVLPASGDDPTTLF